jgi:hypothetical protein
MRDVPDMCNLKSCDSAHNIQAWRINNNSYVAQLYKKDSSHEIRKSDFLHQIQPWFNHSLKTVRYNAEEDVKELQRHYQSTLAKLQQNYSLNCAHSPQNQNEYTIQYQLQVQHELYKYRSQLQKLLHLLCTVTVVDMNDYGYYVIAQFVCNTTPRIPL